MKIIIEDSESFKFFSGEGHWTDAAGDAKPYASALHAYNVARQEPIGKFNIAGYVIQTDQLVNLRAGRGTGISAAVV
jgi:hypothetical protein